MRFFILLLALGVDRFIGDPDWLWGRLPHPVVVFGRMISFCDRRFNKADAASGQRARAGLLSLVAMSIVVTFAGSAIGSVLEVAGLAGLVIEALVVAVFLAQKSLFDHVRAVADGLATGGIEGGRVAVAKIVGRDPESLDRPAVSRAAIESLAENFSDGVVAPAFWYLVGGLPGLFVYKLVNTADSMIGHLNDRYRDFGRASARLDDVMNWPAARLSAGLIVIGAVIVNGAASGRQAFAGAMSDAGLHRSPNAGWPEAAIAGALNLSLGGPRSYGGAQVHAACLNGAGRRDATGGDVVAALRLVSTSSAALALLVGAALLAACFFI